MSFDVSLWAPVGAVVDLAALQSWLTADDRVGAIGGDSHGFEAVTSIGGAPWAAVLAEDVSDLELDDMMDPAVAPAGLAPTGVRVEISYSTPDQVVAGVLELVGEAAGRFGWVIIDDQADELTPVSPEILVTSWLETSAQARAVFDQHQRRER